MLNPPFRTSPGESPGEETSLIALPASVADSLHAVVYTQRALAWLLVDSSLVLADAGGNLGNYGLETLRIGEPACEQAFFLEGLLPLNETPFRLRSVEMASRRVADLHFYAEPQGVWIVLLDVTAERDEARLIQQKAYEMTLLSEREAQLIAKLEAAHRELQRTHGELTASRETLLRTHNRLERELHDAARYVRSNLPPPFTTPFVVDWRYVPSTELGGDSFGYHWVDPDHFALYLLDVCGHGVGAALLSVIVANTLRSETLAGADFRAPAQVLTALNRAYQMEQHDNLYFTIWYGVYDRVTRQLEYAGAGHPPAILVTQQPDGGRRIEKLQGGGPSLGIMAEATYCSQRCTLPAASRLFLFSDGAYEIRKPDGTMLEFDEFLDVLVGPPEGESELDRMLNFVRALHGPGSLEDDFSIVKLEL